MGSDNQQFSGGHVWSAALGASCDDSGDGELKDYARRGITDAPDSRPKVSWSTALPSESFHHESKPNWLCTLGAGVYSDQSRDSLSNDDSKDDPILATSVPNDSRQGDWERDSSAALDITNASTCNFLEGDPKDNSRNHVHATLDTTTNLLRSSALSPEIAHHELETPSTKHASEQPVEFSVQHEPELRPDCVSNAPTAEFDFSAVPREWEGTHSFYSRLRDHFDQDSPLQAETQGDLNQNHDQDVADELDAWSAGSSIYEFDLSRDLEAVAYLPMSAGFLVELKLRGNAS